MNPTLGLQAISISISPTLRDHALVSTPDIALPDMVARLWRMNQSVSPGNHAHMTRIEDQIAGKSTRERQMATSSITELSHVVVCQLLARASIHRIQGQSGTVEASLGGPVDITPTPHVWSANLGTSRSHNCSATRGGMV